MPVNGETSWGRLSREDDSPAGQTGNLPQSDRSSGAPEVWNQWVQTGAYRPLTFKPITVIRTVAEQMPDTENKIAILRVVYEHYKDSPYQFEGFATRIFQMHDRHVIIDQITRASIDGGRDAIGLYVLGLRMIPFTLTSR